MIENYRGITLLNTSYKWNKIVLRNRSEKEMEKEGLLPDMQTGFREGRNTMDYVSKVCA